MEALLSLMVNRIVQSASPEKIILFGSRGRGQESPDSDYDFLIVKRDVNNRRALAQHLYRVLADVPATVDILVETPETIEKHRNTKRYIYGEAEKGRVVYER